MGYTHCYTIHDLNTDLRVPEIAQDISRIIMASEIPIGGEPAGPNPAEPALGPTHIIFNGVGDDSCESFVYPPGLEMRSSNLLARAPEGLDSCKTWRQPYDVVVCAALIALKHHLGDNVKITSDGRFDQEEWQPAYQLYCRALRRELPQPFRGCDTEQTPETQHVPPVSTIPAGGRGNNDFGHRGA